MTRTILFAVLALACGITLGSWWQTTKDAGEAAATETQGADVYRCPMHPTIVADHAGSCPVCGMDLVADAPDPPDASERHVAYWRAPMDPSYVADGPGTSPMGMDLIPVYEDELSAQGTVTIDPVTAQNIGVRTALVEYRSLQPSVRTMGRVDFDETRMTDVNTKVAGWVERLFVDFTGQEVTKGEPLLELYSPELVAAQQEYLTALDYAQRLLDQAADDDVLRGAHELLAASLQRLRHWDVSDAQIERLQRERSVTRTVTIYSPQEGVVVHKAVLDGAHINPGQHLYRIAELSRVWVTADVYEYELPLVALGQQAQVSLSYLPGRTFTGRVSYIYPYLDAKTRTVKVRMSFDNSDRALKPEMYANVTLRAQAQDHLSIPVQAVIHSGERRVAIVALAGGRFQPRDVELGLQADGWYEVLAGLREGESIVTSAQFLIDS
ncbi:MAG: efflux RND transporter periplasmic adaptor subunit, partial [Gemmatimonadetes bacterium]|nr:efflux RND transporter periplasmic adaptor subunit [Gemmatimonadota bacterium]